MHLYSINTKFAQFNNNAVTNKDDKIIKPKLTPNFTELNAFTFRKDHVQSKY